MIIFAADKAPEAIYMAFDKEDTDVISLAQIHRNRGLKRREDGSYSVLIDVTASTTGAFNGFDVASMKCFTFIVKDDMMCVLGKRNPSGSFDDCPPTPAAEDFAAEDGAGLDLDAMDVEVAQVFRRPTDEDGLTTSADTEWPAELAGLWKGEEWFDQGADEPIGHISYNAITEGYVPNPWIFLDKADPSKIVGANIGKFAGAEQVNGTDVFRNDIFKHMPGSSVEMRTGRERWCNSYVIKDDQMFMFSKSSVEGTEEAPECPKAPDIEQLLFDEVAVDKELLSSNGANAAGIFTRLPQSEVSDASSELWPEDLPGIWLGRILKSKQPDWQGTELMMFITGDVPEHIITSFDKEDTDVISLAQIHRNRGLKRREDGSYSVLIDVTASTTGAFNGFDVASMKCFTFIVKDDMMCVLGKRNPSGSFDDCPPTPAAEDFAAEDGAGLDLDAMDVEVAQVFRRPTDEDGLTTSADTEWPAELAGLWKGEEYYNTGDNIVKSSMYHQITEGYVPNPWIFLDEADPSKIVGADIGNLSKVEEVDGAAVYQNTAFKYMLGTGTEQRAGRERWCNSYVVKDDTMITFSNSAPEDAEPGCPKAPDSATAQSSFDKELLESNGAVAARILTKQ